MGVVQYQVAELGQPPEVFQSAVRDLRVRENQDAEIRQPLEVL